MQKEIEEGGKQSRKAYTGVDHRGKETKWTRGQENRGETCQKEGLEKEDKKMEGK